MSTFKYNTERGLILGLALFAALLTGCNAQPVAEYAPCIMGTTASPASVHMKRNTPLSDAHDSVNTFVANSPMLSATCSPAFRMVGARLPAADPTEAHFIAFASSHERSERTMRSWQPMTLLTSSASPAFLHATRSIAGSTPMRPETTDSAADVIQTDAD